MFHSLGISKHLVECIINESSLWVLKFLDIIAVNFGVFICPLLHGVPMRAWFEIINFPLKLTHYRQIYLDISDFNVKGVLILPLPTSVLIGVSCSGVCELPLMKLDNNVAEHFHYCSSCLPTYSPICLPDFYIEITSYWLPLGNWITQRLLALIFACLVAAWFCLFTY